jgi:hypothetical protein
MSRRTRGAALLSLVLGLGISAVGANAAAAAYDPDAIPLTVEVTGTARTGTVGTGSAGGAGSSGRGGVGSAGDGVEVDPGAEAPGGSDVDPEADGAAGLIGVGGLRTSYLPSANPLAGTLHVEVSVQNLSDEVIAPTVALSLRTWFGLQLSAEPERPLGPLGPGELRTAEVDLTGVGQWTVVAAYMTLTPPEEIGGVEVGPVQRARWVLATPWFLLAAAALGLVGVAAWRGATRVPAAARALGAAS